VGEVVERREVVWDVSADCSDARRESCVVAKRVGLRGGGGGMVGWSVMGVWVLGICGWRVWWFRTMELGCRVVVVVGAEKAAG
jgi:hypothetical protein